MKNKRKLINKIKNEIREKRITFPTIKEIRELFKEAKKVNWKRYK